MRKVKVKILVEESGGCLSLARRECGGDGDEGHEG